RLPKSLLDALCEKQILTEGEGSLRTGVFPHPARNLYVSSAAAFAMIAYDAANARYVWRIQPVDAIV
ncbi:MULTISPECIES: hypothetical protein, partial [unclassified Variovorax]